MEQREQRDRFAIALDVDDLVAASRLAKQVRPYFGIAKVGLELYTAHGPDAVITMADLGYRVFLDLKMLDIPTTVNKAARVAGALGANLLTFHAFGTVEMLQAGVEGLTAGAEAAGLPAPIGLGVTILTSDAGAPPHILGDRIKKAQAAGCGGFVCSAANVQEAKQLAPELVAVVPGIRAAGADTHDQATPATPVDAFNAGADLLVIGRAVTKADDPAAAAAELTKPR